MQDMKKKRIEDCGRDFIVENKNDAAVWRDLDAFQRANLQESHSLRIHQTLNRKEELDFAKRQEAENALENRERVKKIRQYIENQIEKQRIGAWRLQLICGRIQAV